MEKPQNAVEVLHSAAKLAKTPQETEMVEHIRGERAGIYGQSQARNEEQSADAQSAEQGSGSLPESPLPIRTCRISAAEEFVPKGPHRFVVGVFRAVRCEASDMDLTVTSGAKTLCTPHPTIITRFHSARSGFNPVPT